MIFKLFIPLSQKEVNRYLINFEKDHKEPGDWDIGRVASLVKEKRFEVTFAMRFITDDFRYCFYPNWLL